VNTTFVIIIMFSRSFATFRQSQVAKLLVRPPLRHNSNPYMDAMRT